MSTLVRIQVPAADVICGDTFDAIPEIRAVLERVALGNERAMNVWMSGAPKSAIRDALSADPSVRDFARISAGEDEYLFEIDDGPNMCFFRQAVRESDGTLLKAFARRGTWTMVLRFPAREAYSKAKQISEKFGIEWTLESVRRTARGPNARCGLTNCQYEVLKRGLEEGYFEIPREVNQEELADELDISHQALSERVRRAEREVISSSLLRMTEQASQ